MLIMLSGYWIIPRHHSLNHRSETRRYLFTMRVIKDGKTWEKNLRGTMQFKERESLLLNAPVQLLGGVIRKSSHWDSKRWSETKGLSLWYPGLFFNLVSGLISGFLFGFIIWLVIWIPVPETLGRELIEWNRKVAKAEHVAEPVCCWHWKLVFVILTVMNTVISFSASKQEFKAGVLAAFWGLLLFLCLTDLSQNSILYYVITIVIIYF